MLEKLALEIVKVTLKRENSTIHRKQQKLHCNTFNTYFRNGPRGKKITSLKHKENQGSLPGKILDV